MSYSVNGVTRAPYTYRADYCEAMDLKTPSPSPPVVGEVLQSWAEAVGMSAFDGRLV
jgi:hypothetical protein